MRIVCKVEFNKIFKIKRIQNFYKMLFKISQFTHAKIHLKCFFPTSSNPYFQPIYIYFIILPRNQSFA